MIVGCQDHSTTWYLPKDLLTHSSPFFAAALNGSFAEAISKSIKLPEDDPAIFGLFVRWLYIGGNDEDLAFDPNPHVEAWILGDKLGCQGFKDSQMYLIMSYHRTQYLIAETVRTAYEGSVPGCKLRKYIVDQFRWDFKLGNLEAMPAYEDFLSQAKVTEDFGVDFMRAYLEVSQHKVDSPLNQKERYSGA